MKVLDHVSEPHLLFTYTISSLIIDNYITNFSKHVILLVLQRIKKLITQY